MDGECNNNSHWRSLVSTGLTRDVDDLPAPTQEKHLDSNIITADERYFHPNLFGKRDDKKYLKVIYYTDFILIVYNFILLYGFKLFLSIYIYMFYLDKKYHTRIMERK